MEKILFCTNMRWSPEIGDPTFMGWMTVAAYAVAAIICLGALTRRKPAGGHNFWAMLAFILILLMFNKQLDLQSALTAFGRCASQAGGWYEHRRAFQAAFIVTLLFVGTASLLIMIAVLWRDISKIWLAVLGIFFIMTFVAIRAVGFHHMDQLINSVVAGARVNWILELGGITMIILNAAFLPKRSSRRH